MPWAAHRGLLGAVIGMGLLIVISIAVVAYGLVYKMSGGEESAAATTVETPVEPYRRHLELAGAQDTRSFAVGDLLAIEGATDDGARIVILFEPRSGREVGRFLATDTGDGRP